MGGFILTGPTTIFKNKEVGNVYQCQCLAFQLTLTAAEEAVMLQNDDLEKVPLVLRHISLADRADVFANGSLYDRRPISPTLMAYRSSRF